MVLLVVISLLAGTLAISASQRAIVPHMNFVGKTIELSLKEAVKKMQTDSSRAETAQLNREADNAAYRSHKESAEAMATYFDALALIKAAEAAAGNVDTTSSSAMIAEGLAMGITESNHKIVKKSRDFALSQRDNNYKAELNEIEAMTVELYYGINLAEENLKIARDNLANVKAVDQNVQKKYQAGAVARIDTVVSKNQVQQAEGRVATAETGVKKAKMSFNLLMGYDLMQSVKLKDDLTLLAMPRGTLTGFIEGALNKRNEIKGVRFAWEIQNTILSDLASGTAAYSKQRAATGQARKSYDDIPLQIEMDIRSKYMDLQDRKRDVELAKANQAVADEAYRLAKITFDVGVNTLTDVDEAGIMAYQAALGVAAAITDYNVAVYNFNHAIDVGTVRIPL